MSSIKNYKGGSSKKNHQTAAFAVAEMVTATIIPEDTEDFEKHQHIHHSGSEHIGANTHNIKQWPATLREKLVKNFKRPCDERRAGEWLGRHEWPEGLKGTVYKSVKKIPLRFFIIDDSGKFKKEQGKGMTPT